MTDSCSNLTCNLVIDRVGLNGIDSSQKCQSGEVQVCRNGKKEICLKIVGKKVDSIYRIDSLKVHGKFLSMGKATLEIDTPQGKRRIMISNAAPVPLTSILKLLMVKFKYGEIGNILTNKNKYLLSSVTDEISPVRPKEMETINQKLNKTPNKTPRKNTTPIRKLQKRRILAERNGLVEPLKKRQRKMLIMNDGVVLNTEQREIVSAIKEGCSIFFTGAAGTGKSFLLKELIKSLPSETTAITASTGAAAAPLCGSTLHAFAGIGIGTKTVTESVEFIKKRRALYQQWRRVNILIIDEISMVDSNFFDLLEEIARNVRANSKPFGGIQLILCGDFLQLPPVIKRNWEDRHEEKSGPQFCFHAKTWDECVPKKMELHEIFRQSSDPKFCKLLAEIRRGSVPKWVHQQLRDSFHHFQGEGDAEIKPTRLMTHTKQVAEINRVELGLLKGTQVSFDAEDSTATSNIIKMLNSALPNVPQKLELKIGAQVMLTKNISVSRGLVNGSRGRVISFHEEGPKVKFKNIEDYVLIKPERFPVKLANTIVVRTQIPLKLAWAMSIHKSQGMSLDACQISLSNAFECGQAYVALSRCRTFAGLRVLDFDPKVIRAHPAAIEFHNC